MIRVILLVIKDHLLSRCFSLFLRRLGFNQSGGGLVSYAFNFFSKLLPFVFGGAESADVLLVAPGLLLCLLHGLPGLFAGLTGLRCCAAGCLMFFKLLVFFAQLLFSALNCVQFPGTFCRINSYIF